MKVDWNPHDKKPKTLFMHYIFMHFKMEYICSIKTEEERELDSEWSDANWWDKVERKKTWCHDPPLWLLHQVLLQQQKQQAPPARCKCSIVLPPTPLPAILSPSACFLIPRPLHSMMTSAVKKKVIVTDGDKVSRAAIKSFENKRKFNDMQAYCTACCYQQAARHCWASNTS